MFKPNIYSLRHRCELHLLLLLFLFFNGVLQLSQANSFGSLTDGPKTGWNVQKSMTGWWLMGANGFSCSHHNMTLENPTRVSMLQVGPVRGVIGPIQTHDGRPPSAALRVSVHMPWLLAHLDQVLWDPEGIIRLRVMWQGISGSLPQSWVCQARSSMLSFWLSFWIHSTFCNHAEQLQHQGPVQPLLLRDGQRQPWFVVSAVGAGCGEAAARSEDGWHRSVSGCLHQPVRLSVYLQSYILPPSSLPELHWTERLLLCILLAWSRPTHVVALLSVQSFATESRFFFYLFTCWNYPFQTFCIVIARLCLQYLSDRSQFMMLFLLAGHPMTP